MSDDAGTLADLFRLAVARAPDNIAYHYFDGRLTYRELDREADALAAYFEDAGVAKGDRVMVCLQNVPAVILALVACNRVGAIAVMANPMYRQRELTELLDDCSPKVLICHDRIMAETVRPIVDERSAEFADHVLIVSPRDRQRRDDPWIMAEAESLTPRSGEHWLETVVAENIGRTPAAIDVGPADTAMLVYTSGTTGSPKGAMISHANMRSIARFYHEWTELKDGEGVLALAPLFHVTGLSGHVYLAISAAAPLVLSYRFEPAVMLGSIVEHRPAFAVGAITAFAALLGQPGFTRDSISSLRHIFSGGAPIPPAMYQSFFERTGLWICNVYGLTETSGAITASRPGQPVPVDPGSGTVSVGFAINDAVISFRDEDGRPVEIGQPGELVVAGPGVMAGYWNKPEESAAAIGDCGFRTGDVAYRDKDGWIYLVDRKKDMIIASGFKVWPREVENILYTHPAVREAAVIGVTDAYRGETVKAVISLKANCTCEPEDIVEYCRARLAAYKYPRIVEIIDDLPKTLTGKIVKAQLR